MTSVYIAVAVSPMKGSNSGGGGGGGGGGGYQFAVHFDRKEK